MVVEINSLIIVYIIFQSYVSLLSMKIEQFSRQLNKKYRSFFPQKTKYKKYFLTNMMAKKCDNIDLTYFTEHNWVPPSTTNCADIFWFHFYPMEN